MLICCALFFILGYITWANGALIPFVRLAFNLETDLQAFFILFASYIAYFFLALPSSWILDKIGFKNGIVSSLLLIVAGALIILPAASQLNYSLFLIAIFIQASGMALLQTAINPYLSIIGPIESAAQRISIVGIFNKGAGIIVPIVLGSILLKDYDSIAGKIQALQVGPEHDTLLTELGARLHGPYIGVAIGVAILAVIVFVVKMPDVDVNKEEAVEESATIKRKNSIFNFPHLFLGAFAIFFCVAVEVMAGDIIGTYGHLLSLPPFFVKYGTAFTLGCMLLGYFIGIATIPRFISQQSALRLCTIVGIAFTTISVFTSGMTSYIFVALLGVANALMWPAVFPLGIKGLGRFTKVGSGIMIMGIAGGAIWPLFYGYLKDTLDIDFQHAFLYAMIPAYLYILYFASYGHRVGQSKS
ncbi:sugar MFS transporter [Sphingobacterium sp. DN00404]|uniref:Sugar MFS transporter n=2 Tax=Sphingobacterium micropteri TaxID=2763501 RepID=A0ABR7YLA2_9SPHI|nr:sugar MFS transporter [Sphingobacterium micropteri]